MNRLMPCLALSLVLALAATALAQDRDDDRYDDPDQTWAFVRHEGDVDFTTTPNPAKIHVRGFFEVATADYFRGQFDGVDEDCDNFSYQPGLSMTLGLPELGDLIDTWTLTAGMVGGLVDTDEFPGGTLGEPDIWYQADAFAGVAIGVAEGFLVGVTYTAYTAPNDWADTNHEIAGSVRYGGDNWFGGIRPNAKVAVPVDGPRDGFFTSVGVEPTIPIFEDTDFTISAPIDFGVGWDDYYTEEADNAFFAQAALMASVPIHSSRDYGDWNLTGGAKVIWREDEIERVDVDFDEADEWIVLGMVGIEWAF